MFESWKTGPPVVEWKSCHIVNIEIVDGQQIVEVRFPDTNIWSSMKLGRENVVDHPRIENGRDLLKSFRMEMGVGIAGGGEDWPKEWLR